MNAAEYKIKRNELMSQWEQECRQWLKDENEKNNNEHLNVNATFFMDGVLDPEIWFHEENTFRPLFILKEVNDQNPTGCATFDFVDTGKSDIYKAESKTWRRFSVLVDGLITHLKNQKSIPPYVETYSGFFHTKTQSHQESLHHIAVINAKKFGGGEATNSVSSKKTIYFTEHTKKYRDSFLKQQIAELIKPDIIFFCGADTSIGFEIAEDKLYGIPVITIPHPSRGSNVAFYDNTIARAKEITTKCK